MINRVKQTIPDLLSQAVSIKAGADLHGDAIGLKHSVSEIEGDIAVLEEASFAFQQARTPLATLVRVAKANFKEGRRFLMTYKHLLTRSFGNRYSEHWNVAGFYGDVRVPTRHDAIISMLQVAHRFLADNTLLENIPLGITALEAATLFETLQSGRSHVHAQEVVVKERLAVRVKAQRRLAKRVRAVMDDLKRVLEPLDPIWLAFGLNLPGAKQKPEAPENITVVVSEANTMAVKWEETARAEYYRVWTKVGEAEEFTAIGMPVDPDFTIENLPANTTIQLAVSAVNSGGESARSTIFTMNKPHSTQDDSGITQMVEEMHGASGDAAS